MNFSPSLLTAALAGAFSAVALPLLRTWIGNDAGLSMPLILAMIVTVALPVQAFVIGARTEQDRAARTLDKALLKRIGAWLLAAVAVSGVRALFV